MNDADWSNFDGDTAQVCLACGYRWPIQNEATVTEQPGCPECGHSSGDVLTETTSSGWDAEERLIGAKLEIEVWAGRNPEGVRIGWLKEQIDEFLAVLINHELDTVSKLSGAPASVYKGFPGFPVTDADHQGGGNEDRSPARSMGEQIRDFLTEIRGRRAGIARGLVIPWDGEEHIN